MSDLNPLAVSTGGFRAAYSGPTVEDILEKGLHQPGASPVHIAFRGTARRDSIRCDWRGIVRTAQERERYLRFRLEIEEGEPLPPTAAFESMYSNPLDNPLQSMWDSIPDVARGGLSTKYQLLICYADYRVQEYLLGSGPGTLTVAYDAFLHGYPFSFSYEWYKRLHESGAIPGVLIPDEAEYARQRQDTEAGSEAAIAPMIGGRESVFFLAPAGAHITVAVQAWQAVAQWDLQLADDGSVEAARYGTPSDDPEYRQPLDELASRIEAVAATDAFAGKRIASADGLRAYYESIGAYDVIGPYNVPRSRRTPFAPSPPPPPRERPGDTGPSPTRTPTPYVAPKFVSISSGGDLTCGLREDGIAVCWGDNETGKASPPGAETYTHIGAGWAYSCALRSDGSNHVCGIRSDGTEPGLNTAVTVSVRSSSGMLGDTARRH